MFEYYNSINKIPEYRYEEMNQIMYDFHLKITNNNPSFELHGKNFDNWVNMIRNDENYNIILYIENNKIIGLICYGYYNNELMISEIQIIEEYQYKGLVKILLKEMVKQLDLSRFNGIVCGTIRNDNEHSKQVFTHIGMKPQEEDNLNKNYKLYKISYDDLVKYLDNNKEYTK